MKAILTIIVIVIIGMWAWNAHLSSDYNDCIQKWNEALPTSNLTAQEAQANLCWLNVYNNINVPFPGITAK